MNFKKAFYHITLTAVFSILLFRCTLTTTNTKAAVFRTSNDSIARDINSIILTQEVNLHGEEITTNKKVRSVLTVNLINPQALPNDTTERNKIGEHVAELLKHLLKNQNEFDSYKVLFVNRAIDGAVTKSTYTGEIYDSKSLANRIYIVSIGDKLDSSTFRAIGKTTFSNEDIEIILGFKYYYASLNSPIKFKMYKETDSGSILLTTRNIGQTKPGNNYVYCKLNVTDFYKITGLGSGAYRVKYLLNDSVVETRFFKLL
jgi:hypothetical protein